MKSDSGERGRKKYEVTKKWRNADGRKKRGTERRKGRGRTEGYRERENVEQREWQVERESDGKSNIES